MVQSLAYIYITIGVISVAIAIVAYAIKHRRSNLPL
jgi:hypothetical protein